MGGYMHIELSYIQGSILKQEFFISWCILWNKQTVVRFVTLSKF